MLSKTIDRFFLFLPWALLIGLYWPVFYILYKDRWEMFDYGHAPFILPISLFITWTTRQELTQLASQSSKQFFWPGLLLIIASAFLFIFGWRWDYMVIQSGSLIPLLAGMASFLYGPAILRPLAFPLLYLVLLVPPPIGILDSITLPMRHFSSVAAEHILRILQYPVTREGLLLQVGGHEIFLGAPCSGFRSLITMLSLGLVYVYFNKGDMKKNLILIAAIVPLAMIGNIIRVLIITFLTYYFGSEVGQGFLHEFSGIVVFLIMLTGLIIIEKGLRKT